MPRWSRIVSIVICCLIPGSWLQGEDAPGLKEGEKKVTEKMSGHWGEDAIGFRWEENDSKDGRWNETEIGPFLGSTLAIDGKVIPRSLAIQIPGTEPQLSVNYDLAGMQLRGVWSGGFLQFDPTRFGIINPPGIKGKLEYALPEGPGWEGATVKYQGVHRHQAFTVLKYLVDGVSVLDGPRFEMVEGKPHLIRCLEIEPAQKELMAVVGGPQTGVKLRFEGNGQLDRGGETDTVRLRIPAHEGTVTLELLYPLGTAIESSLPLETRSLSQLAEPGPGIWKGEIEGSGRMAPSEDQPYVIDTVGLPFRNPWNALFFVSGHDFFSIEGRGALCTMHGDVWLFNGVEGDLSFIGWQRFATGLFQPLGLKIINDEVYVICRDQIVRLHDQNNDGEADYYECFFDDFPTSPGGHDFVTCLETDSAGNLLFVSVNGVHRVSPDGERHEVIATGLRNPNGMSVGPGDFITVAPQEGTWTPASAIYEVRPGMHFGFDGPKVTPERPLGYDPPLCWIPRRMDNSTGGQVWAESERWGPLGGHLFNLSFGQCRMQLTLIEPLKDSLPAEWPVLSSEKTTEAVGPSSLNPDRVSRQGGLITIPLTFDSGIMRGRMNPHDGQMYLSGLRGWSTAAVKDGCLQRVRYTGKPVRLPTGVHSFQNGIALTFSTELDADSAVDPGNYFVEQWNYLYSEKYGSPELRPSAPKVTGRDEVVVKSATLLDSRTVFLELADLQPVMQLAVQYALTGKDGVTLRDTYYHTMQEIPQRVIDPAKLTPAPAKSSSQEQLEARLKGGVLWRFKNKFAPQEQDAQVARMLALANEHGSPITSLLSPDPCQATAEGYLQIPLKGSYTFEVKGRGRVRLRIGNEEILAGEGDLTQIPRRTVQLRKGFNQLEVNYEPAADGAALSIWWAGDDFAAEPIQPASLFHVSDDSQLMEKNLLREGRELFANQRCQRCHPAGANEQVAYPEWNLDAPDLRNMGDRVSAEWLVQWIANPQHVRTQATMPRMFDAENPEHQQQIRDLAAYLQSQPSTVVAKDEIGFAKEDAVVEGEKVFETLGCIACHTFESPEQADRWNRVSLHFVGAKFSPGELREFLRAPHARYQSSRMPDFRLSAEETEQLAAYLQSSSKGEISPLSGVPGDPLRGADLFRRVGCAACHNQGMEGAEKLVASKPLAALSPWNGCLAEQPAPGVPQYKLTNEERVALKAFLEHAGEMLRFDVPAERTARLIQRFNCAACHDRDGVPSPRLEIIAEEGSGKPQEPLPNLTWTGEKLHAAWVSDLLQGKLKERTRPWLPPRMPVFGRESVEIPAGLVAQHGLDPHPQAVESATSDPEVVELGRKLTLAGGLDCRQCHGVGAIEPRGDAKTKIALGINFMHVRERLTPEFYRRFVLDPGRSDPNSRMPKLAGDGRTTKINFIYDGDARRQFNAIWEYIRALPEEGAK